MDQDGTPPAAASPSVQQLRPSPFTMWCRGARASASGNTLIHEFAANENGRAFAAEYFGRHLLQAGSEHPHSVPWLELLRAMDPSPAELDTPNFRGATAIHLAVRNNNLELVLALVEMGANVAAPNDSQQNVFHIAALVKHTGALQALLAHPRIPTSLSFGLLVEEDEHGNTPLHYCVLPGPMCTPCQGMVGAVLDAVASPDQQRTLANRRNARDRVPAVLARGAEVVRRLVAAGTDLRATDDVGATLAHWAAYQGDVPKLEVLVEAGASLTTVDHRGFTPLHEASLYVRPEVVGWILDHWARMGGAALSEAVQALTLTRDTPLHLAMRARANNFDVIWQLVVRGGAQVYGAANSEGLTPLDCASDENAGAVGAVIDACPENAEEAVAAAVAALATRIGIDVAVRIASFRYVLPPRLRQPGAVYQAVTEFWATDAGKQTKRRRVDRPASKLASPGRGMI